MTNPRDKFDLFLTWLREVGGKYNYLHDDTPPNPKRANYEPKHKTVQRPLNPKLYRVDENGCVRKISEEGLRLAEKLGV